MGRQVADAGRVKTVIVIPARLEATRLPRKLLRDLGGKCVLRWTWERAQAVPEASAVLVAADSEEVAEAVRGWGGEVRLTDPALSSGTLRIASLLDAIEADFVLNVQGDEPFIEPELLSALIQRAGQGDCDLITAVNPIRDPDDLFNPNIVKALRGGDGRALYFTRAACPHVRGVERAQWLGATPFYRHIGVYGYTPEALRWYAAAAPSRLEEVEKLEQLRFVEHGWRFQTVETAYSPTGIDTAEDLARAEAALAGGGAGAGAGVSEVSPHYTVAREVMLREAEALESALVRNRETLPQAVEMILQASGKVVVTGLGKSGIVGHKIAATLASTGTSAVFISAAEALHGDLGIVAANDVVLMLSHSAATAELSMMLPSLKTIGARSIGLFGKLDTPLAQAVELVLDTGVRREACPLNLAPMSSTTATMALGDALAAAHMQARGFRAEDFSVFHPGGSPGRRLLPHDVPPGEEVHVPL